MASLSLGEHSKITAPASERGRIRAFYREVLELPQTRESEEADIFRLGTNFFLGFVYSESALSPDEAIKAIWLEIRTDHLDETKRRILKSGVAPLDYWDKANFYFQAPGGQVFRLVAAHQDMSRWEG